MRLRSRAFATVTPLPHLENVFCDSRSSSSVVIWRSAPIRKSDSCPTKPDPADPIKLAAIVGAVLDSHEIHRNYLQAGAVRLGVADLLERAMVNAAE